MKIILTTDIKKLGNAGEIVNVANGYARNYLLPKNFAILATPANMAKVEDIKKEAELARLEIENRYKALVLKLKDVELKFNRKADENDHLFGSVSEVDIVNSLQEMGIEIHKSHVMMEKHIKELGEFEVKIEFTSDITCTVKVIVENE